MKTAILPITLFLHTMSLLADDARPAPTTIKAIMKERIAVQTQIIENTKRRYDAGEATPEDLLNETIELDSLNRDFAKTRAGKISWQDKIIALEQKKEAFLEKERTSGGVELTEVLRATERVLAAKQKRLELMAAK